MANDKKNCADGLCFDEIGHWSEIKFDIVKEYAPNPQRLISL